MIGVILDKRKSDPLEEKLVEIEAGNVVEEMKTFGKECK